MNRLYATSALRTRMNNSGNEVIVEGHQVLHVVRLTVKLSPTGIVATPRLVDQCDIADFVKQIHEIPCDSQVGSSMSGKKRAPANFLDAPRSRNVH
jgi:hypothetical protein